MAANQDISNSQRIFLCFSGLILLFMTLFRMTSNFSSWAHLNQVSGVWLALANDLVHGVFYRPIISEMGIGGTRYFPLHFILQAGLIKTGLSLITSGFVISALSMVALLVSIYLVMLEIGIPSLVSFSLVGFVCASASMQLAVTTIRGDLLPTALTLIGFLFFYRVIRRGKDFSIVGSTFFCLAFLAKPTSIFAVFSIVLYFISQKRYRSALLLTMGTVIFVGISVSLINWASGGSFYQNLEATSLMGVSIQSLVRSPREFMRNLEHTDPICFIFLILSISALLLREGSKKIGLIPIYFLCSVATISTLFASAGVDYNHFIDLHIATLLVLGESLTTERITKFFAVLLGVLGLTSSLFLFDQFRDSDLIDKKAELTNTISQLNLDSPVLSDNPLISLLKNQTPFILDPYAFQFVASKNAQAVEKLHSHIGDKYFQAVLFMHDPRLPLSSQSPQERVDAFFGAGFWKELSTSYDNRSNNGPYFVFLRK